MTLTDQQEMTVEQALAELREMFPSDYWIRIDQSAFDQPAANERIVYQATISIDKLNKDFEGATLSEAMAQVREWKAKQ